MTLSLLCCASAPADQVAAVLAPLRPVVDEIVVCVSGGTEAYAGLADRVVRIGDAPPDSGGVWPYSACRGDWVLRIDDDEVPSAALVSALGSMTAASGLLQVWLPTRRLLPDGRRWVRAHPWSPGYEVRLVRNDGTSAIVGPPPGRPAAALPARYVEAPVYCFGPLGDDVPDDVATDPVDERDAEAIAAVLAAGGPVATTPAPPDAGAQVAETAYAAAIEPLERELRLEPGASGTLHVRVVNQGDLRWPWGLEQPPLIRVGYRLRDRSAGLIWEGPRSPLTEDVPPGASAIVPVRVDAPARPMAYDLELDLVHEGVRWFQRTAPARLVVAEGGGNGDGAAPVVTAPPEPFESHPGHDRPPRAPDVPLRPYVICVTPRSGSTLLSHGLIDTGRAGVPVEYFSPIHREEIRAQWGIEPGFDRFLAEALARRTTANGVFGVKVHWDQLQSVHAELGAEPGEPLLERLLPGALYVRLVRRDLDEQAVSLWVASRSGQWRRVDGWAPGAPLPPYSYADIALFRRHIEEGELAWERYLRLNGLPSHTVLYEDLSAHYAQTVRGVLAYLGVDDDVELPPPTITRQRNEETAEILERFRADRAAGL